MYLPHHKVSNPSSLYYFRNRKDEYMSSIFSFYVHADVDIKYMSFIAEYTGHVDYIENMANDDCDSIMTLLSTTDPSKKLLIWPDITRGNTARFINGINDHTP